MHFTKRPQTYGITEAERDMLLAAGCGWCGKPFELGDEVHIDHDHDREHIGPKLRASVRAAVHANCNYHIARLENSGKPLGEYGTRFPFADTDMPAPPPKSKPGNRIVDLAESGEMTVAEALQVLTVGLDRIERGMATFRKRQPLAPIATIDRHRFALESRPSHRLRCAACGRVWGWADLEAATASANAHRCPKEPPPLARDCAGCGEVKEAAAFRQHRRVCHVCEADRQRQRRRDAGVLPHDARPRCVDCGRDKRLTTFRVGGASAGPAKASVRAFVVLALPNATAQAASCAASARA